MSIKSKILLSMLLLAGAGFGIISAYCLLSLEDLGRYAEVSADKLSDKVIEESKVALLKQSRHNLETVAEGQAAITGLLLQTLPGELEMLNLAFRKLLLHPPGPETMDNLSGSQPADRLTKCAYSLTPGAGGIYENPQLRLFSGLFDCMRIIFAGHGGAIDAVYIAGTDGALAVFPWQSVPAGFDPRLRSWHKRAVNSRSAAWSEPYFSATTGNLLVTCALAVRDDRGTALAVSAIDVNVGTLIKTFPGANSKLQAGVFILDRDGWLIGSREIDRKGDWKAAAERQNLLQSQDYGLREAAKKMTAGERGIVSVNSRLQHKIIAFAPVPGINWSVGVSVPEPEIIGAANDAAYLIRNELAVENNFLRNDLRGKMRGFMIIGISFLIALTLIGIWLSERLTKPLRMLIKATRDIGFGDFSCRIPVRGKDEIAELAGNFNSMIGELKTYMKELEKSAAAQERVENELELGIKIQTSMLPEKFSKRYSRKDIDLAASILPARKAGGDFYDFTMPADHLLYFCIGDISDKGIPAAIFMAQIKTLMLSKAMEHCPPAAILKQVNDELSGANAACMFANVFCGIADLRQQTLAYCNAAYSRPLIAYKNGDFSLLEKDSDSMPVGPFPPENAHYAGHSMDLRELRIVLYSNAVIETADKTGEGFGIDRLKAILNQHKHLNSEETLNAVQDELNVFAADDAQPDDIAMLMIKFKE